MNDDSPRAHARPPAGASRRALLIAMIGVVVCGLSALAVWAIVVVMHIDANRSYDAAARDALAAAASADRADAELQTALDDYADLGVVAERVAQAAAAAPVDARPATS